MKTDSQTDSQTSETDRYVTVAGTNALPGVLRSNVTRPSRGVMTQSVSRQSDRVPAASRWTAGTHAAVVPHTEDTEAQRVLHV